MKKVLPVVDALGAAAAEQGIDISECEMEEGRPATLREVCLALTTLSVRLGVAFRVSM